MRPLFETDLKIASFFSVAMTNFRQTKLPQRFRKKVKSVFMKQALRTPKRRRVYKQTILTWGRAICDICAGNNKKTTQCCGVCVCSRCEEYFYGKCPVCDKDELNEFTICDICDRIGNMLTVRPCPLVLATGSQACTFFVCATCSRQGQIYDRSYHFCSVKHYRMFIRFVEDNFTT